MKVLHNIREKAINRGSDKAMISDQGDITYRELWEKSDKLATWLNRQLLDNKGPVVVYGHKNPMMLVCFLACVKSGRAYCPVDISMPINRIEDIVESVDNELVLSTENLDSFLIKGEIINLEDIKAISERPDLEPIDEANWVKANDIYYIIFTSGSTGAPKGVEITYDNLNNYLNWSINLGLEENEKGIDLDKKGPVYLNQAPFSFDLSVMDLYNSLARGGTLWSISKKVQENPKELIDNLGKSNLEYWVSTPSFADMTMANKEFNQELLNSLKIFLFCGEKLTKETARKLRVLFPNVKIINTYGPTESTVAITAVLIEEEMLKSEKELPIGVPKEGTQVRILDEEGREVKEGEKGEIFIVGDTVSSGYFKDPVRSGKVFSNYDGKRQYKTGDQGFMSNGMAHYCGRIDLQIKLHGYRIELGDIEANLIGLNGVEGACVVPRRINGKIRSLVAFVVSPKIEPTFTEAQKLRKALKEKIPEYMVPKKVVFLDKMPMTRNDKIDRKALEERV